MTESKVSHIPDAAVERLAQHIYRKECLFKSLDDAAWHMSNWRRAIPEAREMLEAAFPVEYATNFNPAAALAACTPAKSEGR